MNAVILTGASRGLGLALATDLALAGTTVVGVARKESEGWCALAARCPGSVHFIAADLSSAGALSALMPAALAALSGQRLRTLALINNAGVVTPVARVGEADPAQTAAALHINLLAPMVLTGDFIRLSEGLADDRRVLNISSGAAVKTLPGWAVYGATKAGLDHYTRHVAAEAAQRGKGLRVVSLYPGVVDTDMQATIRSSDPDAFPDRPAFEALKRDGGLASPADTARRIATYLFAPSFGSTPVDDIRTASA